MDKTLLKGLTPEQIEKAKNCKSNEEILSLAKQEGVELTDEQLAAVSGGCGEKKPVTCPKCGSVWVLPTSENELHEHKCLSCGEIFRI